MSKKKKSILVWISLWFFGLLILENSFQTNVYAATIKWPVPGYTEMSQRYHDQSAIDISAPGGATIIAAMGGTVTHKFNCPTQHYGSFGDCNGFGTGLVIQGDDGRIYQYAHMMAYSIPSDINVGSRVNMGQRIGQVGTTGFSSGNHLHFGISLGSYGNKSGINPEDETYDYSGGVSDTEKPSISNIQVSNVTSQGYTVTCNVSDNVGVATVKFPTWTEQGGQDDLIWHVGNVNGNVASFYVSTSEHGYGAGQYFTHIYAYDAAGNYSMGTTSAFVQKMYTPISMTTYNGHIYALFDESIGWDNAKAVCESMGGHLVTITSSGEETAVQKLLTNGIRDYYFCGAYEETEGNWKWVNGDTYQYTHWYANQPDNAGGIECVLSLCKNHEGWNDISKDYPCGFILEIDKKITPAAKAYYGNTILYEIYDKALPYPVAREYCKLKGGQLACIDTADKNTFIVKLAQNVNKDKFFFGLERASIYGEWYNSNGKSQTYSNWAACQPDAFLKLQTSACVMKDYQWDDEYCYRENIGFVKEIPISSIRILSVKKNYKINESTKPDSMVLYAVYKDGSTRRIFSGNTVTGFSTKNPGSYKATVKYANLSTTFSYKVELPATQIIEARSASYKAVYLKWNKVSGATGYKILMATKPSGTYQTVRTVSGGSSCSASVTNLDTGKTYYFKVQPYCTTGSGTVLAAASSYKYGKPSLNKGKIQSVQFVGEGKVRITWSKVSGAYGYEIFRATSKNGTYRKHSTASGGNVTAKTISTGDKKYYYRIRAYRLINGKKVYGALSDSF